MNTEYRENDAINYSKLSQIDNDPSKILLDSPAFRKGNAFEDLLFFPKDFDKYYAVEEQPPTATGLNIVEYAKENNITLEEALNHKNENGYLFWNSIKDGEKRLKKLNKNLENYLNFLIESEGKNIISEEDYRNCRMGVNILKFHRFTKEIFKNGTPQQDFYANIDNVDYKILVDWIVENDEIFPYDLKSTSKSIYAAESSVFMYRYDLQSSLYTNVLRKVFPNKKVHPLKNVFYSFKDEKPIIIEYSEQQIENSKKGFYRNNKYYKGWWQLTKEYLWHVENGFEYKYDVMKNNGIIVL